MLDGLKAARLRGLVRRDAPAIKCDLGRVDVRRQPGSPLRRYEELVAAQHSLLDFLPLRNMVYRFELFKLFAGRAYQLRSPLAENLLLQEGVNIRLAHGRQVPQREELAEGLDA